jgi:hypothetical protein
VTDPALVNVHRHLEAAVEELRAFAESAITSDGELLSVLTVAEGISRKLDQVTVSSVAVLQRRGTFTERGYKNPAGALSDLLGWEGFESRRRLVAADQVCIRIGLDGTELPARLPRTAQAFTTGQAGLRHVGVIADLLATPAAGRLSAGQRVGVEEHLAEKTAVFTPTELRRWGTDLINRLDQDGPEPENDPDSAVNELVLRRNRDGQGGRIEGRFDDARIFDSIATLIDAMASP